MEGLCIRKGIVIGMNLIFGLIGCKTRGSCLDDETEGKWRVSAISLHGALHVNWLENDLFGVLVVL